jgi:hypothetical protein
VSVVSVSVPVRVAVTVAGVDRNGRNELDGRKGELNFKSLLEGAPADENKRTSDFCAVCTHCV